MGDSSVFSWVFVCLMIFVLDCALSVVASACLAFPPSYFPAQESGKKRVHRPMLAGFRMTEGMEEKGEGVEGEVRGRVLG